MAFAVLMTAVGGWAVADAWPVLRADVAGTRARTELQRWTEADAPWTLDDWQRVHAEVTRAIGWTPKDASLHELLSALLALRGNREWGDGDPATSPGVALYREAVVHQQRALDLRPRNAMAWAQMALLHYAVGKDADALWQAWRRAATLGPNEADVRFHLTQVAREAWAGAPDDVRALVNGWQPGLAAQLDAEVEAADGAASAPATAP